MTNLVDRCRHFTGSIDLTLLTTDWAVLHKRVMRGNFRGGGERGEYIMGGCCGQLIEARVVIMIV